MLLKELEEQQPLLFRPQAAGNFNRIDEKALAETKQQSKQVGQATTYLLDVSNRDQVNGSPTSPQRTPKN